MNVGCTNMRIISLEIRFHTLLSTINKLFYRYLRFGFYFLLYLLRFISNQEVHPNFFTENWFIYRARKFKYDTANLTILWTRLPKYERKHENKKLIEYECDNYSPETKTTIYVNMVNIVFIGIHIVCIIRKLKQK